MRWDTLIRGALVFDGRGGRGREAVAAEHMLNRSDSVVTDVWITGAPAWRDAKPSALLGQKRMGSALTVESTAG